MKKLCMFTLICGLLSFNAFTVMNGNNILPQSLTPQYASGRILVKFKPGQEAIDLENELSPIGARVVYKYRLVPRLALYYYDQNVSYDEAEEAFLNSGIVEYCEPDYIYQIQTAPNDSLYSELWGMENLGQTGGKVDADINAESMWNIATGSNDLVIGVIDTGVDYTHSDLTNNMWRNSREIANNGIDDDGNGYVDDIHGINAINNSGDPKDDNGHGTHCAGTIGAEGNNNEGVIGVAPNVRIAGCKFLSSSGSGYTSDAMKCLDYFYDLKRNNVNIVATSNSWGGGGSSQSMATAIREHRDADMLFIAAAGNSSVNNDEYPHYPSNYQIENVISVAATNHFDDLAYFSNYGKNTVHVGAPGRSIVSTYLNNNYESLSGTSMATPHVAGLSAVIKSYDSSYNYQEIKNLIMTGGQKISALDNKTITGRRIRGADNNGIGSLTCFDQMLVNRLSPENKNVDLVLGDSLLLKAKNINCKESGADLVVNEALALTLKDNGANGDETANDGISSYNWTPEAVGTYQLEFGNGDVVEVVVSDDGGTEPGKNYVVEEVSYNYINISGVKLDAGDDTLHGITYPFPIHYNGDATGYDRMYISSNGTLSFTESILPYYINSQLPLAGFQTFIAPYYDDLTFRRGEGDIYAALVGSAPNRKLVVEYRDYSHYYARGKGTFQVVFYENSPNVRFNYRDVDLRGTFYDNGKSATVGVQTSSENATQHSYNSESLRNGMSLLFKFE